MRAESTQDADPGNPTETDRSAWLTERMRTARPTLEAMSMAYVIAVLEECNGNKSRAATILGVSRRSLYRWLAREAK